MTANKTILGCPSKKKLQVTRSICIRPCNNQQNFATNKIFLIKKIKSHNVADQKPINNAFLSQFPQIKPHHMYAQQIIYQTFSFLK